jgi:hypothetical protein
MVTLSNTELENRRPVWIALSELFLDTNLDADDIERLAQALARSPYTLDELERVLLWEVYPACRANLVSIAGEWSAFDPNWLESKIRRPLSGASIAWAGTVGRLGLRSSITWRRIKRAVVSART